MEKSFLTTIEGRELYSEAHATEIRAGVICIFIFDFLCLLIAGYGYYSDRKGYRYLVPP